MDFPSHRIPTAHTCYRCAIAANRLAGWVGVSILLLSSMWCKAQPDTVYWQAPKPDHYSFIGYKHNTIIVPTALDSLMRKLVALRATRKGKINIIHIGDSHLQADGISSVVRRGFQAYFGNAGRGLVFPYQVAGTNAPPDVASGANNSWQSTRMTNSNQTQKTGISGWGLHSTAGHPHLQLHLKKGADSIQEYFDKLILFLGVGTPMDLAVATNSGQTPYTRHTAGNADTVAIELEGDSLTSGFELKTSGTGGACSFYGVSLEHRNSSGVLYHMIGVNGARYEQFLQSGLLWQQLSCLQGDAFILSLGTNEAQTTHVDGPALTSLAIQLIARIHEIAPAAAILITSPAPSYLKGKKPNASLLPVAKALRNASMHANTAYWDMLQIGGGTTGAIAWKNNGLLGKDLVHYTADGYRLQGQLLLDALSACYTAYARKHPYKAPTQKPARKPTPKKPAAPTPKAKTATVTAGGPAKDSTNNTRATADTLERRPPRKSNIKVIYME